MPVVRHLAEEAAAFYTSIFKRSRILDVVHYGKAGPRPEGMVMTVSFELDGERFVALNGGPEFTFSEAISFQVSCESQLDQSRRDDLPGPRTCPSASRTGPPRLPRSATRIRKGPSGPCERCSR